MPAIIAAIEQNYAAPSFNKLSSVEKVSRFQKSKQQLLIAMLEATESKGFSEIIEDEFSRIKDKDQRILLLIIAIATVPRVGISKSMANVIVSGAGFTRNFDELLEGLQGIVDSTKSGRFQARHQVYASEIVQKHASLVELEVVLQAMVKYYVQFKSPIIKNVSTHDGQLFKYLLNNNNIYQIYKTAGKASKADSFFAQFEIDLQLDGHYWLQYALLLRRLGRHKDALEMLGRSIAAYPGNAYAQHALAQQKLILAAQQPSFSAITQRLIDEAVGALIERHHSMGADRLKRAVDEYPMVALGYYHIDALMSHGMIAKASTAAKAYFQEIDKLARASSDKILIDLRARLLLLVSTGEWRRLAYKEGQIEYK